MRANWRHLDEQAFGRVLPSGTPDWVTPELVEATLRCWQRYYDKPLTVDDAVTILRNAGRLFDALAER